MPVNISKLWGNAKFSRLSKESRLLYIYMTTHPSLNRVGVFAINPELIAMQTSLTMEEVRESSKELIAEKYIYVKKYEGLIYFIVPAHFATVSNSDSNIERMRSDFKSLPKELVKFLDSIGIAISKKFAPFEEPDSKEITEYALSIGYYVNGEQFSDYYRNQARIRGNNEYWMDSRGKIVRDWKAKLRNVWCKDEFKVTLPKGAPKGYEYLYVIVDGRVHCPSEWKDGLPRSKDFLITKELRKEYEERRERGS